MKISTTKKELFGRTSIGSWITIGHPAVAEIMAEAGFDWLAVDLEHSAIDISRAEELIRVIDLKGVIPLVRLSSINPEQIKRVMDSGARGVIAPMVKSRCDAENVVNAVRYPPFGQRSFGLARAQGYGLGFDSYLSLIEETIVVAQIEHIEAVNNLEEILSVPGIDAYFVGPYDLSGSLGVPGQFEEPSFLAAMTQIADTGRKMGIPGGMHIIEPDVGLLEKAIQDGAEFIAYSLDTRILDVGVRKGLEKFRR
jgi:2-keto-3-deoxy-L-rhamnonate aldolase RhmA